MKLSVPLIKQQKPNTCGAACLAMVLHYFNKNITEKDITNETMTESPLGRHYIKTAHLVHYAILKGYTAFHCCMNNQGDLKKILDMNIPVIVLQRYEIDNECAGHFRVVIGYKNNSYIINDPEKGEQKIPEKDFRLLWKKQPKGENIQENMFILILPKDKIINHSEFNYDMFQFRKCGNPKCPDPFQEKESVFQCNTCKGSFEYKEKGIPFGCLNQDCTCKYWQTYTCKQCGFATTI